MSSAVETAFVSFRSVQYLRHNARRQEHLASLGLPLHNRTVLELGAGVGDHTTFFLDRGCDVVALEARQENLEVLAMTYRNSGYRSAPKLRLLRCDVESAPALLKEQFEVVYAYGLLYHLSDPESALRFMADRCADLLLLETCVCMRAGEHVEYAAEPVQDPTQAYHGVGCRPSRLWLLRRLRELFPHVYVPLTQPAHEEFPLDWTAPRQPGTLSRAVFIASRHPLEHPLLTTELPDCQRAC